jgi:sugar lactone lactonase YvrE
MPALHAALLVGAWALALTTAGCASDAESEPTKHTADVRTYELPGSEVYPEGVEVFGTTYYVGSVGNGDVYRGELDEEGATVFVPGGPGHRQSEGIEATDTRLLVANGSGATVYDRATGELVAHFSTGLGDQSNVNDIAVTPNGDAYLTDFELSKIYRIPAAELERADTAVRKLPVFLDLAETHGVFLAEGHSANGIVASPDGQFLLVAHYTRGELYRIRLSDKKVTQVDLQDERLRTPDGMVLTDDDVLYVVEADASDVAAIALSNSYLRGEVQSRTKDPAFVCPTTDDIADGRLLVVNSQFCVPGKPPFTMVSIPLP